MLLPAPVSINGHPNWHIDQRTLEYNGHSINGHSNSTDLRTQWLQNDPNRRVSQKCLLSILSPRLRVRVRMRARRKKIRSFQLFVGKFSFPSGECYMRDVQCERAGCHSERPPSMKPPSCGACRGHPIPNICAKPFGVGWRLCASEQRVGAFEGCRSAHDHFGFAHSCSLPPSPRRGPVDGTDSAPTKSLQARQVGRRGVSDSLKLGLPQRSTT